MGFDWQEAAAYYRRQGAPSDQNALVQFLKEVQGEMGGSIPPTLLAPIAEFYGITVSFLQAVIKRIPSLRLSDNHLLEICSGPNCGKHSALVAWAEKQNKRGMDVKFVGCMRMCGKGPNVRLDGQLYHGVTIKQLEQMLQDLT